MSCGAPADNKPANIANASNANSGAKPTGAAPTAETFKELEKKANEAYIKSDSKYFEELLSEKAVMFEHGQRMDKASIVKMVGAGKCDFKEGWTIDDTQMAQIANDTYAFSSRFTSDGSCTMDGKTEKMPSPVRAATIWVRNGEKWQAAYHAENMIIDPKNPPKQEAKKEEPKKEAPKKEEAKKDAKPAGNSNAAPAAPSKPTPDANTDALVKIHTAGWEAFKAKDAKKFGEMTMPNLAIVDPMGNWVSGQQAVIKQWTETMKYEGITKVGVSDGVATALSPSVEVLTLKGTADGKCDGQNNGGIYQTAVYVKTGDAWKLAFMFESLAKAPA